MGVNPADPRSCAAVVILGERLMFSCNRVLILRSDFLQGL